MDDNSLLSKSRLSFLPLSCLVEGIAPLPIDFSSMLKFRLISEPIWVKSSLAPWISLYEKLWLVCDDFLTSTASLISTWAPWGTSPIAIFFGIFKSVLTSNSTRRVSSGHASNPSFASLISCSSFLDPLEKFLGYYKLTTLKESCFFSGWQPIFNRGVLFDIIGRSWTANDSSETIDKSHFWSELRSGR